MSKFKKGLFSNYQFSKPAASSPKASARTERQASDFKANIYEIGKQEYFKEKTARVDVQIAKKVQQTKEREEQVMKKYKKRIQMGLLFMNYKQNPFLVPQAKKYLEQIQRSINQKDKEINNQINISPQKQKGKNIVQALNKLTFATSDNRFNSTLQSKKMEQPPLYTNELKKMQEKKIVTNKMFQTKKSIETEKELVLQNKARSKSKKKQAEGPFADLERIVGMEDQNQFETQRHNRQINIFHILHLKKGEGFTKSRVQILAQHNFCFELMANNNNNPDFSIKIEQDILPTYKRANIMDKNKLALEMRTEMKKNTMKLNINKIEFKEIIDLVNGKTKPLQLKLHLKDIQKTEDEPRKQHFASFGVAYLPNQRQVSTLNDNQNELNYLNALPYTQRQETASQLIETYKQQFRQLLKMEQQCENRQIFDKKLRKKLKDKKNKLLMEQIKDCGNGVERKKRVKLITDEKDRRAHLKIKGLTSTVNIKKIYETAYKSWSKSKNKTTRFN